MLPNPYIEKKPGTKLSCRLCSSSRHKRSATHLLHFTSYTPWPLCDAHTDMIRRNLLTAGYKQPDIDQ